MDSKTILYRQAKMRCRALIAYGKSASEIKADLENSFYPEDVVSELVENIEAIEKEKFFLKTNIKIPNNF